MRQGIFAALVSVGLFAPVSAHAAQCVGAPDRVYQFDVRTEIPAAHLDRSRSRAGLNRGSIHGLGPRVGAMQSQLELSRKTSSVTTPTGSGHCYWIESIDLVIRFRSLDIFIASEYRRDSCAYRAILSHEREHVRVAREQLNRFAPRFRQALHSRDVPSPSNPRFTTQPPKAEIEELVDRLVSPVFDQLNVTMANAQARLDTPEEYARIQAKCSDW